MATAETPDARDAGTKAVPPAATEKPEQPAVVAEQDCPCGSGKPFSKCHGAPEEEEATA